MFLRLFLIFTCIPLLELYILLRIGAIIGVLNTVLLVIFTGVLGAYLAQLEGLRTMERIRTCVARGEMPGDAMLDAFLILIAGFLLITPGVLTDGLGFFLLVPAGRRRVKKAVRRHLERRFNDRDGNVTITYEGSF